LEPPPLELLLVELFEEPLEAEEEVATDDEVPLLVLSGVSSSFRAHSAVQQARKSPNMRRLAGCRMLRVTATCHRREEGISS